MDDSTSTTVSTKETARARVMQWYAEAQGVFIRGFDITDVEGPFPNPAEMGTDAPTGHYFIVFCNKPGITFTVFGDGVVLMEVQ